ncbi:hypothetical protein Tco_0434728 [Tanacetum coccineum]
MLVQEMALDSNLADIRYGRGRQEQGAPPPPPLNLKHSTRHPLLLLPQASMSLSITTSSSMSIHQSPSSPPSAGSSIGSSSGPLAILLRISSDRLRQHNQVKCQWLRHPQAYCWSSQRSSSSSCSEPGT